MPVEPALRIFTLGRFSIEVDGRIYNKFVSQKAPLLFLYLLSHPREHSRQVLAEMFWEDTSSQQALKNLRTVLSNLQKILGLYLDVTRQTIQIVNAEAIWLDTRVFETELTHIGNKRERRYSPRKRIAEFRHVLDWYQGDFLLGVKIGNASQLDTWIMLEQDRLRQLAVNAMLEAADLSLTSGYIEDGLEYARKLIVMEPFWEDAQRTMMRLLVEGGYRSTALQQYDAFVKLLEIELNTEPEMETQTLYQAIKTGRLKATHTLHERPNNLSAPSTPYVETPQVIQQIQDHLDDLDCRLLTIMGQGGMGKTSLARHVGIQRLEDYTDGVFFVSLISLTVPELIPLTILEALGIQHQDTRQTPLDLLLGFVAHKHLLLILDNFDHLIDSSEIITVLLDHAPDLQILVTSREQLNLQGEQLFRLRPLSYPHSDKDISASQSVQLFIQMATLAQPDFDAMQYRETIIQICQLVDGLPLGIVIAAAWVQFLPPDVIASRIQDSLDFLTVQRRDLPEHHRGIMALLRMTWADLSDDEREIMMKISVFPGDFDVFAVDEITGATPEDLRLLISKSLMQTNGQGRFWLHELLRRFSAEQANAEDLTQVTREAHRYYYKSWLQEQAEKNLPIHTLYRNIDHEYHNITYIDWLDEAEFHQTVLDHAPILTDYWIMRGYSLEDGVQRLNAALPHSKDMQQTAHALYRTGQLLARMQHYDQSEPLLEEGLGKSREVGDVLLEAKILNELYRVLAAKGDYANARLNLLEMVEVVEQDVGQGQPQFHQILSMAYSNLGIVHMQMDDPAEAENFTRKALNLKDVQVDPVGTALCHNTLGVIALKRENLSLAEEQFHNALQIAFQIGHTRHQTIFSGNLAEALHKQGQYESAYDMYYDTLQTAYQIDNHKTCLNVLEQLSDIAFDMQQMERSAILLGVANQLRYETGLAVEPRQKTEVQQRESRLQETLIADQFSTYLAKGKSMSLHEAVIYIRDGLIPSPRE